MVNVDQSLTGSNNYISSTINQLINYLKILSTYDKIKSNQSKKLCYFINNLQNLNTKCQNNSGKCLQQLDITVITEIGNFLSIEIFDGYFYSSTIPNKLTQLWNILQVSEINMLEVITGHNNKDYVKDQKIFEKVFDAANNTEQFIQGVKKRNLIGIKNT
jgi:hypothetical protein